MGIGDSIKSGWDSASGWIGKQLKDGASWGTRQVVDGVKTSFGGAASPESKNGFEPGAFFGEIFGNAPWWLKIGAPLLSMAGVGLFFNDEKDGMFDKMKHYGVGIVAAMAAIMVVSTMMKQDTKAEFTNNANKVVAETTADPDARLGNKTRRRIEAAANTNSNPHQEMAPHNG